MIVYIDEDFKCHAKNDGTMREIETDAFGDKCRAWVESYRIIPYGETWMRSDGTVFNGFMMVPWKSLEEAYAAQEVYDDMIREIENSYTEGVNEI